MRNLRNGEFEKNSRLSSKPTSRDFHLVAQPTGSDPCHVVIHDGILVTLHKYSNSITSQRVPLFIRIFLIPFSNLLTVPEDQASLQGAKSAASVLIPSPNTDFSILVHASNRNTGLNVDPRGGMIAIFTPDTVDGKPRMISQFSAALKQVRGCNRVDRIASSCILARIRAGACFE